MNVRGDGPIRTRGPVLDYATGMHAASSVMSALLIKAKTGEGQYVDIGMQDVAMLLINRETSVTASTGQMTIPDDNRYPPLLGRFETSDGYAMLAGYMPVYCRDICSALGLSEYTDLSDGEIWGRITEIQDQVEYTLLTKTSAEWDDIFSEARVVAGGVRNLIEVFATGQPAARELLTDTRSAVARHQVTTAGYRINDRVFGPEGGVPLLGEHTRDILAELGISGPEFERLRDNGIVFEP